MSATPDSFQVSPQQEEVWAAEPGGPAVVLVTHHCEEIPRGFTHGALMRAGRLVAAGALTDAITSDAVSACFGIAVTVGETDGRWWSRAV